MSWIRENPRVAQPTGNCHPLRRLALHKSTDNRMISKDSTQIGINGMTTVAEAAKILEVSPRRVLQFIREKRLRAQQVNARMYLLELDDVRKFKKQPRETGNPMFKKSRNTD